MSDMPAGSASRTIALCYVRQSLTRDEMPQHSPDRQKANITALCQEQGWMSLWFVDADGHRSGYGEANRPAWQQLKDWLAHPQVVAIVANEPSRVYRQMWRMGRLMEDLDQQGVQLRFASPSSPVRDISHPADRFLLQIYALLDEHLVHDLSRRTPDASPPSESNHGRTVICGRVPVYSDSMGVLVGEPNLWNSWQVSRRGWRGVSKQSVKSFWRVCTLTLSPRLSCLPQRRSRYATKPSVAAMLKGKPYPI